MAADAFAFIALAALGHALALALTLGLHKKLADHRRRQDEADGHAQPFAFSDPAVPPTRA